MMCRSTELCHDVEASPGLEYTKTSPEGPCWKIFTRYLQHVPSFSPSPSVVYFLLCDISPSHPRGIRGLCDDDCFLCYPSLPPQILFYRSRKESILVAVMIRSFEVLYDVETSCA